MRAGEDAGIDDDVAQETEKRQGERRDDRPGREIRVEPAKNSNPQQLNHEARQRDQNGENVKPPLPVAHRGKSRLWIAIKIDVSAVLRPILFARDVGDRPRVRSTLGTIHSRPTGELHEFAQKAVGSSSAESTRPRRFVKYGTGDSPLQPPAESSFRLFRIAGSACRSLARRPQCLSERGGRF